MIQEGERAPDFELRASDGQRVRLSALEGRPVVLSFYPQDRTPGYTKPACAFRDVGPALGKRGVRSAALDAS